MCKICSFNLKRREKKKKSKEKINYTCIFFKLGIRTIILPVFIVHWGKIIVNFFFFFFLCCLSEWEMEVYEPSPGYRGPSAMVPSNFLVLSRPWVQTRRIRCEMLVSPFNLPGVVKTTCLYACMLKIRIW